MSSLWMVSRVWLSSIAILIELSELSLVVSELSRIPSFRNTLDACSRHEESGDKRNETRNQGNCRISVTKQQMVERVDGTVRVGQKHLEKSERKLGPFLLAGIDRLC